MKAAVIERQGGLENLVYRDWPDPEPRAGEQPAEAATDDDHVHLVEQRRAGEARLDVGVVQVVGKLVLDLDVLPVAVGTEAPIALLAEMLAPLAEVTVVAPERDRSGSSNSLTLDRPLTARRAGSGFYYVNGTPTDCVHVALTGLLAEPPDLVISGINDGANMGEDTLYSGTVAAATEGYLLGFPAIAVSLALQGGEPPRQLGDAIVMGAGDHLQRRDLTVVLYATPAFRRPVHESRIDFRLLLRDQPDVLLQGIVT